MESLPLKVNEAGDIHQSLGGVHVYITHRMMKCMGKVNHFGKDYYTFNNRFGSFIAIGDVGWFCAEWVEDCCDEVAVDLVKLKL